MQTIRLLSTVALLALLAGSCGPAKPQGNHTTDGATWPDSGPRPDASNPNVDDDGDGYTENQGDCDDASPLVHPMAEEICTDGVDNNCNGATDVYEPDQDGDGFGPCQGDCDDDASNINPAQPEIPDGVDNNCDGIVDGDYDGDGYTAGMGDCADTDPDIHPGAAEDCYDGVDNNCNGYIDRAEPDGDFDGYGPCQGDCDDTNPNVGPHLDEIPGDGIDNNCDFLVDQDIDADGWTVANGDCDDNDPDRNPAEFELCGDNIDNNCDGLVDQECMGPCELAEALRSSVGCEYYAVDANNDPIEGYDTQPYAVIVSNTHATDSAFVEVQTRQGGVWTAIQSATVAAGTLHQFDLPDRHINYTGLNTAGAYRVISDLPVIAYQFQPVNGATSYTSDASLLLPKSSLDQYYYVLGWGVNSYGNAQLIIMAATDGTTVTMTPSTNTAAGGVIPALTSGVQHTFTQTLNAGDYIQLEGTNSFTGTYIESNHPISVFSTHWCANIPSLGCCCDHLEEQLFGLQTWGMTFVAGRFPPRNTSSPEATQWHILASEDNTQINFRAHASVTGLPASPQTLNAGEVLFLQVSGPTANPGDFLILADKPILVMEYLSSSFTTGVSAAQAGDPAMSQAVPVEQFLDNYVVLVPANWIYDHLVLIKPVGAVINLDGAPVPVGSYTVIDDGINPPEWEVGRVAVADGIHNLNGTHPFGVIVLGYDSYDSYAYPGGLNQALINPVN